MKIIFANGRRTYPLFQGGDGININDLLNKLGTDGHDVIAIGKIDNPDFRESINNVKNQLKELGIETSNGTANNIKYKIPNSYGCVLLKDELFEKEFRKTLIKCRPDIILTQLNYSHKVIEIASSLSIKVILFVHDHHPFNYLPINRSESISHVFFNSKSTQHHFSYLLKCTHSILYSPLSLDRYKSETVDSKYITMVNPTKDKGEDILKEIIRSFPNQNFLIVSGWRGIPKEFSSFKNVKIVKRQYDMKKVYIKTKILLVPSQWEEAFGRVVIEAMINKIPVIASRVGGLPESIGLGGILINDFVNPKSWIESINKLLGDQVLYKRLGDKGYNHALSFDINIIYPEFLKVLDRIHRM